MQEHSALLPPSLVEHLPPFWHGLSVHGSLLSAVTKNIIIFLNHLFFTPSERDYKTAMFYEIIAVTIE